MILLACALALEESLRNFQYLEAMGLLELDRLLACLPIDRLRGMYMQIVKASKPRVDRPMSLKTGTDHAVLLIVRGPAQQGTGNRLPLCNRHSPNGYQHMSRKSEMHAMQVSETKHRGYI